MSRCKHCGSSFFWENIGGKWIPYDDAAKTVIHRCQPGRDAVTALSASRTDSTPVGDRQVDLPMFLRSMDLKLDEILSILKGDLR